MTKQKIKSFWEHPCTQQLKEDFKDKMRIERLKEDIADKKKAVADAYFAMKDALEWYATQVEDFKEQQQELIKELEKIEM